MSSDEDPFAGAAAAAPPDAADADAPVPSPPAAPAAPAASATAAAPARAGAAAVPVRKLRPDEMAESIAAEAVQSAASLIKSATKGGNLMKRSDQGLVMFRNWKKRWVMLCGNLLYYFEQESSPKPQGIVQLAGAAVQLASQKQFKGQECVAIKTKTGRCFYFYGSSYENKAWFDALKTVPEVKGLAAGAPEITEGDSLTVTSTAAAAAAAVPSTESPTAAAAETSAAAAAPSPPVLSGRAAAVARMAGLSASAASVVPAAVAPSVTLADMPDGESKRTLDPARDLGVTDAVNALMTSLPPDVQVVWLQVLSAACKARETEESLGSARAALSAAGEALSAQKAAAADLAREAGDSPLAEKLRALVEGAAGAATLAGASDAYERGRADAEAELGKLRLEFEANLRNAVALAEKETEERLERGFGEQLEAAKAAARAAERSAIASDQDGSEASWQQRLAEAVRQAADASAAAKEDEINELQRRLAGLESSAKHLSMAASVGSSLDAAALQQQLAVAQGQMSEVAQQLELALVKAESSRIESVSKEARARQLEAELTAMATKLNKATQEAADEYVKTVRSEQEQARMRTRLEKMAQAEKYMGFQADEIMQAKANFLKMKDAAEEARKTAEALERELLSAREVARASEEAAGARDAAEREAQRALEALERVRAEKAELELQLQRLEAAAAAGAGGGGGAAATHAAEAFAAASERATQLEQQVEALRAQLAVAATGEHNATQAASRLGKMLAAVINTTREALGVAEGRAAMQAGDSLDMFGFRDELRVGVESVGKEAAGRAEAAALFARQALEKKVAVLDEQLRAAAEEKAGLQKELEENDQAEERAKRDATSWMTRCRELEGEKKTLEDKTGRLDSRVHQLEMALAEAKSRLYNLVTPALPSDAVQSS